MKNIVCATALLLATLSATAASYQGYITNVTPYNGRIYFAITSGAWDGATSSCYSDTSGMVYSVDPTTAIGKAIFATALSAKLAGKLVYVFGDGTCPSVSNPYNGRGSENVIGVDLKG